MEKLRGEARMGSKTVDVGGPDSCQLKTGQASRSHVSWGVMRCTRLQRRHGYTCGLVESRYGAVADAEGTCLLRRRAVRDMEAGDVGQARPRVALVRLSGNLSCIRTCMAAQPHPKKLWFR